MVSPATTAAARTAWARAETAAQGVHTHFARHSLGVPLTLLGSPTPDAPRFPTGAQLKAPWHYWWQAHYLDALIDRQLRVGVEGRSRAAPMRRLVRGILLRNGLHWSNDYFDDMAWMALALQRLEKLPHRGRAPRQFLTRRAQRTLGQQLRSAHTLDLGGGLFWNTDRTFKNTPATAPAALFFARKGERERAGALLDWLRVNLRDPETGLYLDGLLMPASSDAVLVDTLYTYNQGPVLGALLELGGRARLEQAGELIRSIGSHLTTDDGALRTHGSGDGGLFTGILARYLALAATHAQLPEAARRHAAALVSATAVALDRSSLRGPPPRELSTQLQAWMVFEAEWSTLTEAL